MCFSVPLTPSGLTLTNDSFHIGFEAVIYLEWDLPLGRGPEAIVDNYTISISPNPPYESAINFISSNSWNVTLLHNIEYSLNLTAINCVGESGPSMLTVAFSKFDH